MHPAFLLVGIALIVALFGYVRLHAYGSGRAVEMGMKPHEARSGRSDDSGGTAFDQQIATEVITGRYRTDDPKLLRLARTARALNLISFLTLAVAVAWLAMSPG